MCTLDMFTRPLLRNVRQMQSTVGWYHNPMAYMSTVSNSNKSTEDPNDVLFQNFDRKGLVVLSRPKQLNALNHSMVKKLLFTLRKWKYEKSLIIIKGSGGKAFCAGGDVVAVTKDRSGKAGLDYFRDEYRVDGLTASLTRPYVALMNGITMGGGVGLSINARYRVATEDTLFAMPETQIGLFPDVGATHFLSRLPHNLGVFLCLTGYRLKGFDLYHLGIATHYCCKESLDKLEKALIDTPLTDHGDEVENIINEFHCSSVIPISTNGNPPPFSLAPHLATINKCFAPDDVENILKSLAEDKSPFAQQQLEILKKMSPLSMKITRYQLKNAAQLDIYECLNTDFRIASRLLQRSEFYEGVRALLVDKDKKPKWDPPELESICPSDICCYFEPLPSNEELKLPCSMEHSNL